MVPLGTLIIFFFISVQGQVDKYLFMKRFKEPLRLNKRLCFQISEFCEAAPFYFCIGNTYFGKVFHGSFQALDLFCLFLTALIYFVPVQDVYSFFCSSKIKEDDSWKFASMLREEPSHAKGPNFVDIEPYLDME